MLLTQDPRPWTLNDQPWITRLQTLQPYIGILNFKQAFRFDSPPKKYIFKFWQKMQTRTVRRYKTFQKVTLLRQSYFTCFLKFDFIIFNFFHNYRAKRNTCFKIHNTYEPRTLDLTLHSQPYILSKPEPWTLNPEPWTLNPEPWTLNPEPWTLNPEPW
jgi:hypothetical protein